MRQRNVSRVTQRFPPRVPNIEIFADVSIAHRPPGSTSLNRTMLKKLIAWSGEARRREQERKAKLEKLMKLSILGLAAVAGALSLLAFEVVG